MPAKYKSGKSTNGERLEAALARRTKIPEEISPDGSMGATKTMEAGNQGLPL
jgi:hypothetical protein